MNEKYKDYRQEKLRFFDANNQIGEVIEHDSPSGEFCLSISSYKTGENTWDYSRGVISNSKTGQVIADVKRNFSHFWYSWCKHSNGNEYLLCGEDYQGQTVVNLSQRTVTNHFPDEGFKGHGFCWTNAFISPNKKILAVEGCYWACPYDVVFFDFSNPDSLPYKEVKRVEDVGQIKGWNSDGLFILDKESEIRKSDGVLYESLSDREQEVLDNDPKLIDYRTDTIAINQIEL